MRKDDLILFLGFLLIIAGLIGFAYWNFMSNVNDCTADPIRYGVEQIRENYNADTVRGTITINVNGSLKSWDFGDEYSLLDIFLDIE